MAGLIRELVADMESLAAKKYYKVIYKIGRNNARWFEFKSVIFLKKEDAEKYAEYYIAFYKKWIK
jgi:hypothetical protein